MILQNWWYTTLLNAKLEACQPLKDNISCDVLVVGGGMAGLHAALYLAQRKRKVVLIERNICGGSSTGKSAGFLTPDSELELNQLIRRYGRDDAKKVWGIASQGVDLIKNTVKKYKLKCDFVKQDSLFVGIGKTGKRDVEEEGKSRNSLGFGYRIYNGGQLKKVNKGIGYTSGIKYNGTYGVNPLLYAQGLKSVLLKLGVKIYESTELTGIKGHAAKTHLGSVKAKNIIIAIDKMGDNISNVSKHVYHAQTFLSITEPLSKEDIKKIFPMESVMCWDSTLIYSYYRLTGDNRLLLGGGSALTTFSRKDFTKTSVIDDVINSFKKRFPDLKHLDFIQYWPGRIDTTKDLIPIVDFDRNQPHIQYILGCVGLPWAAFCGYYAAKRLLDKSYCEEYCKYLKMDRKYLVPDWLQTIIGKMAAFSINNSYSKYLQKDNAKPKFHHKH